MATLDEDVAQLARGGLLAFPTETVWGLAANADDPEAVARIARFKGRSDSQPISLLVTDADTLTEIGAELSPAARRLLTIYWPGPLTLVLRVEARFGPGIARAGDGAVGFRCSPHPTAAALVRAAAAAGLGPLTATSCNLTGEPAASTREEASAVCARAQGCDAPRLVGRGSPDASGAPPSTVVDATGPKIEILREGAIETAAILEVAEATYLQ